MTPGPRRPHFRGFARVPGPGHFLLSSLFKNDEKLVLMTLGPRRPHFRGFRQGAGLYTPLGRRAPSTMLGLDSLPGASPLWGRLGGGRAGGKSATLSLTTPSPLLF